MNCPICEQQKIPVVDSRDVSKIPERNYTAVERARQMGITRGIVRERRCNRCKNRIFTHELVIHTEKWK